MGVLLGLVNEGGGGRICGGYSFGDDIRRGYGVKRMSRCSDRRERYLRIRSVNVRL